MKKILCKNEKAFTIVETLVAIFILSLAITGPLFYVSNTFQLARISKYKMTAYFLATETLENIKYERDIVLGNIDLATADADTWIEDLEAIQDATTTKTFDIDGVGFDGCDGSLPRPCGYLNYSSADGFHYDVGEPESFFYRYAELTVTGSPSERKVTVIVGWNDGVISGELEVVEYIYDFNA